MAHTTLVSTAQLASHLDDPAWLVFDCRHDLANPDSGAQEYAKSHIPGAR
ncbi:MAG TPA: rhodanese-like domain-containing protein, partial [Burkholderiales bacterium]